jgi:hypothetical protein
MGVEAYTGARVVRCRDAEIKPGVGCPYDGGRGKLYDTKQPGIFIRLTGQPLVGAIRYEQEVLRRSASCATTKPAGSAKRLYYANALLPRKRVIALEA